MREGFRFMPSPIFNSIYFFPVDSSGRQRSCCKDKSTSTSSAASSSAVPVQNQKLGIFRRLVRGDSFRVEPANGGISASVASSSSGLFSASSDAGSMSPYLPPARVLDLDVEVLTDIQKLEFSWTAPGEDFDRGEWENRLLPCLPLPPPFFGG